MVKKRGLTLIELIIVIALLSVIAMSTLSFVLSAERLHTTLVGEVDEGVNLRIALEYLTREIKNSSSLRLIKREGYSEKEVPMVVVESVSYNSPQYLYIDSERVFLIDNIIRRTTESYHIVSGIKSFWVENLGDGLYTIGVNSESQSLTTRIYRGK